MSAPARRVVYVAGRDPELETGGGHASYVRAHALAALQAGYEPHIFCVGRSTSTFETGYGVIHRRRSVPPYHWRAIPLHAFPLANGIAAFLRGSTGPALVHAFAVWGYAGAEAVRRVERDGGRAVLVVGSFALAADETAAKRRGARSGYGAATGLRSLILWMWARGVANRYEASGYRRARWVLYNYEAIRRSIEARHGRAIATRRIGYSSEMAFQDQPPRAVPPVGSAGAPRIVAISRHDPRKGVDVLLHALALLSARRVPFRAELIGAGPLLEEDRRLAASLGLGPSVEIPGYVRDVRAPLLSSDVFCLPSRGEQSGSVAVLEALQAGVAVAASSCDGIPEDLTDGDDALLVPPGDAHALADALARLLTDAALRRRLGAAGRRTFERRFSAKAFSRELGTLYEELLASAGPAKP